MPLLLAFTLTLTFTRPGALADNSHNARETSVRDAVRRSVAVMQPAAKRFSDAVGGNCFSCHHQSMPSFAVALARSRGIPIDEALAREQLDYVKKFFAKASADLASAPADKRDKLVDDRFPGAATHLGYGLLGLKAEGCTPDPTTRDATALLAKWQQKDGRWKTQCTVRAPAELSDFTETALAIKSLKEFTPAERTGVEESIERGKKWLIETTPKNTEDSTFRLLGLMWAGTPKTDRVVQQSVSKLRGEQRPDGGWAQTESLPSDSYATGQVLVALRIAGGLAASDAAYRRGVDFLLKTQAIDGSWFVHSRATPFQGFIETKFPYGKDQFISCTATAWAAAALALALPEKQPSSQGLQHVSKGAEWPQWRGLHRDGVWRETGIVDKLPGPQIPIKWRVPISSGYSGPTVAGGRVFVTDRITEPKSRERILCFDSETGKPLWTHAYDCDYGAIGYQAGPRAALTIDQDRAYALGAVGHLHCLDANSGHVVWSHDLQREYAIEQPIWGIAAAPLIEGDIVIVQVGGKGACFVAFDKRTGKERWRALNDHASYVAPIVIQQAGKRVMVCRTGDRVVGLNPQTGALYWDYSWPPKQMVIAISSPVVKDNMLFLTSFYDGSLMLRLKQDKPAIEKVWQRCGQNERNTDALHCIISTPLMFGGHVYGVDSYGELRCLDARTGDRIWENQTAVPRARWANIHFIPNGEKVWMFNERGELLITQLSPKGFEEISRSKLIRPTKAQLGERGGVCWSHPAFAYGHVFARNDEELVCADLRANAR